jgi:hypothetical protein
MWLVVIVLTDLCFDISDKADDQTQNVLNTGPVC